jgi:hypothetical protein
LKKDELVGLVEEGFQKPAWHGPNLRGALRGVDAEEAIWRPEKSRHNIWEIVVHAAYWKYTVSKRLTGSKKPDFPMQGKNWFIRDGSGLSKNEQTKRWKSDLELLARMHKEVRDAVAIIKESDLNRPMRGSRQTAVRNLTGIAFHDVYHAGQIQLLRRMYRSRRN